LYILLICGDHVPYSFNIPLFPKLVQPSAGVGVAVALFNETFAHKYAGLGSGKVGIVLCGGNVDVSKVSILISELPPTSL